MNWLELLEQIFDIAIIPLLGVLASYIIYLANSSINEAKQKVKNETASKYLDMLNTTIKECVLATNQTYVEALKKEGSFDVEAQKKALTLTYQNVMAILTEDAETYLKESVKDLETYITNKIEAEVVINKSLENK